MQMQEDSTHTGNTDKLLGYTNFDKKGFITSEKLFNSICSSGEVKKLFDQGYYATAVPTEGGSGNDEYIIVAISKGNAIKAGLKWDDKFRDFTVPIDNSTFLNNLNNFKDKEVTKIGNVPAVLESVGGWAGRAIAIVHVGEKRVPFYVSSGMAGKTDIETGKWMPFFGINDNWITKGSATDMNNYYDSNELRKIGEALDTKLGDPRTTEFALNTIGRTKVGGKGYVARCDSNFGFITPEEINRGLKTGYWISIYSDITKYLEKIAKEAKIKEDEFDKLNTQIANKDKLIDKYKEENEKLKLQIKEMEKEANLKKTKFPKVKNLFGNIKKKLEKTTK